jgi:hypothetical protein
MRGAPARQSLALAIRIATLLEGDALRSRECVTVCSGSAAADDRGYSNSKDQPDFGLMMGRLYCQRSNDRTAHTI